MLCYMYVKKNVKELIPEGNVTMMFFSYNEYVPSFLWGCWMCAAVHLHHPHGLHHCQTNLKLESKTVACSSKSNIILISQLWLLFWKKLRCERSEEIALDPWWHLSWSTWELLRIWRFLKPQIWHSFRATSPVTQCTSVFLQSGV